VNSALISTEAAALGIPFDEAWRPGLEAHLALLKRWAPRINLVSQSTLAVADTRHLLDSLSLLLLDAVRDAEDEACDVGSGAGFPGIPLAIARPGLQWTLVEPRQKRGVFLGRVLASAAVKNAQWYPGRVPDPTLNGRFSLVVSRATLAPAELLEVALPLLSPGGVVAVMAAQDPGLEARGYRLAQQVSFELGHEPRWVGAFSRE